MVLVVYMKAVANFNQILEITQIKNLVEEIKGLNVEAKKDMKIKDFK